MFHSPSLTHPLSHRLRSTASRLWLTVTPHGTLLGAVTRLSYPETPSFPRCQAVQVSPPAPVPSLAPLPWLARQFEPTSSAIVCGKCCALPVRPIGGNSPAFTFDQVTGALPPRRRFMVAQHTVPEFVEPQWIGSRKGNAPFGAQRGRASPTRGTRLQRLLDSRLAVWNLPDWRSGMAFQPMCFLQLAVCPLGAVFNRQGADHPACVSPDFRPATILGSLPSVRYSSNCVCRHKSLLEHQYVWLRHTKSHCNSKVLEGVHYFDKAPYTVRSPCLENLMAASTPIAHSKSAALARVLDLLPKGYTHYTAGTYPAGKLLALARKFHERYGIGCSPAQRVLRKRRGEANALFVVYCPPAPKESIDLSSLSATGTEQNAQWLLLATPGIGPVWAEERLRAVTDRPRLQWLGYELIRHPVRGQTAWTWQRPKEAMAELYALLAQQLGRRQESAIRDTLIRIAHQPGFAGVRQQSWALYEFARQRGYASQCPPLFHLQKMSHGVRLEL